MRNFVMAASAVAVLLPSTVLAQPGSPPPRYEDRYDDEDRYSQDRYDDRDIDDRAGADLDGAQRRFDAAQMRFDRERDLYERERRYFEDARTRAQYDRDRLASSQGTWRGPDGQVQCRRADGTTGTIVGGVAGGLLGRAIDGGRRSAVGTIIGAGAGALVGRGIEQKGDSDCR